MNNKVIFLITVFLGGLVAVLTYGIVTFADLKREEITNAARFQCAQSSHYQVEDKNGAVVWYPVEELYKKCLEEKGI